MTTIVLPAPPGEEWRMHDGGGYCVGRGGRGYSSARIRRIDDDRWHAEVHDSGGMPFMHAEGDDPTYTMVLAWRKAGHTWCADLAAELGIHATVETHVGSMVWLVWPDGMRTIGFQK